MYDIGDHRYNPRFLAVTDASVGHEALVGRLAGYQPAL